VKRKQDDGRNNKGHHTGSGRHHRHALPALVKLLEMLEGRKKNNPNN
jgi:hypothetical protein